MDGGATKSKTKKTAGIRTDRTQPGRHGGTLQVGNPGNKGGGRSSAEREAYMRQRAEQIASDEETWNRQALLAQSGSLPHLSHAIDRSFGKSKETKEVSGELVIRVVYDDA